VDVAGDPHEKLGEDEGCGVNVIPVLPLAASSSSSSSSSGSCIFDASRMAA